jgi:hypothetical protein
MHRSQKAAQREQRQDAHVQRHAHASLVQGAGAAAIGNLHRQTEHEGAHQQADAGRAQRRMQFGELAQQRQRRQAGQRQQQHLAGHALRVPVLDQLAPAGGETKTGTGQRHAHANTHQQQCRLPHRHRQHQENEKGGQQGRQRNPLHGKVPRKAI